MGNTSKHPRVATSRLLLVDDLLGSKRLFCSSIYGLIRPFYVDTWQMCLEYVLSAVHILFEDGSTGVVCVCVFIRFKSKAAFLTEREGKVIETCGKALEALCNYCRWINPGSCGEVDPHYSCLSMFYEVPPLNWFGKDVRRNGRPRSAGKGQWKPEGFAT